MGFSDGPRRAPSLAFLADISLEQGAGCETNQRSLRLSAVASHAKKKEKKNDESTQETAGVLLIDKAHVSTTAKA